MQQHILKSLVDHSCLIRLEDGRMMYGKIVRVCDMNIVEFEHNDTHSIQSLHGDLITYLSNEDRR